MTAKSKVFGIDLGTTHSCIAHIDDSGRPVVLRNAIGEETTPSVVYFEGPDDVLVGVSAKNSAIISPHRVARLVKRRMGTGAKLNFLNRDYSPEEVSALILSELARYAEQATGVPVRDVVITVPAYFGVGEREATKRAGRIAGLTVLDVVAEPVAAALHHDSVTPPGDARHVLVCDLGGGTYDTTVIRVEGDEVVVRCTDGDGGLGGADWDERVRDHLVERFVEQHPHLDPTADEEFAQETAIKAEQLKKDLSSVQSQRTELRFAGVAARVELTRADLERLTDDLLERVVEVTRRTVEEARRLGVGHFDDVLLVGGMTRMPAVARRLRDRLGLVGRLHEPDLAVAKGAALFAVLKRVGDEPAAHVADQLGMTTEQVESLAAKRVRTVVPRAFGVRSLDPSDPLSRENPAAARHIVWHLLHPNTPLPAETKPHPFAIVFPNAPMAEIQVWEQKGAVVSEDLSDNTEIGKGFLKKIPPLPAGSPIHITFRMSETGTLTVRAEEPASGVDVRFDLEIGGVDEAAVGRSRSMIARHRVSG
ncbi:Hsp70 family protein [Actinosynnema sp. NPDC059797]